MKDQSRISSSKCLVMCNETMVEFVFTGKWHKLIAILPECIGRA